MAHDLTLPPLRRLTFPVAPFHDETTDSYTERLAYSNRLRPEKLRALIERSQLPLLDALAELVDRPAPRLALAMPTAPRPFALAVAVGRPALHQVAACNRCVATRTGQEQPIKVFVHPWQQLCPRHGLWRDGRLSRWQYDVSELGDFAQACASHQQLVIRHGFAIAHEAIDLADHVLWQYGHMRAQESAQSARIRRWMETRYPSSPYQLRRDALVRLSRVKISGRTVESVLKENLSYG